MTYTGDGTSNREIAHDLSIAPGMIVLKETNAQGDWKVFHRSTGESKSFDMNKSGMAESTGGWSSTLPTENSFYVN